MKNTRQVYSTEQGRMCPGCGKQKDKCICGEKSKSAKGDGVIRVRREVKGRKGKTVTTVSGVPLGADGLKELASKLKRKLGTGGAVKDGIIEIQGNHCDVIIAELKKEGYASKRAGG